MNAQITFVPDKLEWLSEAHARIFSRPGPGGDRSVCPREGVALERVHGIEPRSSAWKAAALPLCYTRSEGRDLTANAVCFKWVSAVSCKCQVVEGTGFEPVYAKRPDLQSGGFNHSPTPPGHLRDLPIDGSRSRRQKERRCLPSTSGNRPYNDQVSTAQPPEVIFWKAQDQLAGSRHLVMGTARGFGRADQSSARGPAPSRHA